MGTYEPHRKRTNRARERQMARQRRQNDMAVQAVPARSLSQIDNPVLKVVIEISRRVLILVGDAIWYLRHNPVYIAGVVAMMVIVGLMYLASLLFSGNIYPNVEAMGINLGGLSVNEAEEALRAAWRDDLKIAVYADGEVITDVEAASLGIQFDARTTAEAAGDVGLSAFPLGAEVEPAVNLDLLTAQTYLLNLSRDVDERPYNAGYAWADGTLSGVAGHDGRRVDVTLTVDNLSQHLQSIVNNRRLELMLNPLPPEMSDPEPYMDQVRELVTLSPTLKGYDPYRNQSFIWPIPPEEFVRWLAAGPTGLTLREDAFLPYLDGINATLNEADEDLRYLIPSETTNLMRQAIADGEAQITLRVRYREEKYTIRRGDTGYAIGRKTGIPFRHIEEKNPEVDWGLIYDGDEIYLPSRDITMPEPPIPNKRIVVDLDNLYLVAFEDGQIVFEWPVSIGVDGAPTSPGIYQVLNHDPAAVGSSNTLCDSAGLQCGQWEMSWFMGIYEITPGLLNGFHGQVLLPNGSLLGDGAIGYRNTFGCVMSAEDHALALYDWAEVGTVVEIISSEYPPMSDLGQIAEQISQGNL